MKDNPCVIFVHVLPFAEKKKGKQRKFKICMTAASVSLVALSMATLPISFTRPLSAITNV
jgi:hypothetical protein